VLKAIIPQYLFWTKQADALFASRLTDPRAWAGHALILRVSANGLEELWQRDYERLSSGGRTLSDCPYCLVGSAVLMLHGMALECLAKGVIAGLHQTTWSSERWTGASNHAQSHIRQPADLPVRDELLSRCSEGRGGAMQQHREENAKRRQSKL